MKVLIFSDTHLSSWYFDNKKFNFLKRMLTEADRVIIAGDFWEGYDCKFQSFINSPWKKLFPILKNKKTVFVFGNHDKKIYANEKMNLFSVRQVKTYTFTSGNRIFHVEHGDRFVPFFDRYFTRMPAFVTIPLNMIEKILVKTTGMRFIRNSYQRFNNIIKKEARKNLRKNEFIICGHTHCVEIDLKNRFINAGINKHGLGQYIMIEDGKITAHEKWYRRPIFSFFHQDSQYAQSSQ